MNDELTKLTLSMDRADCIAREIIRLRETGQFNKLMFVIDNDFIEILPLAEPIRIVTKEKG